MCGKNIWGWALYSRERDRLGEGQSIGGKTCATPELMAFFTQSRYEQVRSSLYIRLAGGIQRLLGRWGWRHYLCRGSGSHNTKFTLRIIALVLRGNFPVTEHARLFLLPLTCLLSIGISTINCLLHPFFLELHGYLNELIYISFLRPVILHR